MATLKNIGLTPLNAFLRHQTGVIHFKTVRFLAHHVYLGLSLGYGYG